MSYGISPRKTPLIKSRHIIIYFFVNKYEYEYEWMSSGTKLFARMKQKLSFLEKISAPLYGEKWANNLNDLILFPQ